MTGQNPFPGMDPWLELRWTDVHTALIATIREDLGTELPEGLVARAEEGILLTEGDSARADVAVVEQESWKSGIAPKWTPESRPTPTKPVCFLVDEGEETSRWIEIRTYDGEVVTIIEILSPANKGRHRDQYLEKRQAYLSQPINLVEIDLLRRGGTLFEMPKGFTADHGKRLDYAVCVKRRHEKKRRHVYPIHLRDPLPVIAIPLRDDDPDIAIDLQAHLNRVYETGRYRWVTRYDETPLDPELAEDDQQWVATLLGSGGG